MLADQPKALAQFVSEWVRRSGRVFQLGNIWAPLTQGSPRELVLVPQDLRTADPVLAQQFYHGVYSFEGGSVDTKGGNPFKVAFNDTNIGEEWHFNLHSFRWLRHLTASQTAISKTHAQAMVADWIVDFGKPSGHIAWQPEIAAQRLISWLCNSVAIVEQADIRLYNQFLKSIGVHIRFLNTKQNDFADTLEGLQVRLALAYASLCVAQTGKKKSIRSKKAHDALGNSLARQIFADGGHVSRCPSVLPEILIDLLPLRQAYEKLGIAPPPEVISAIDRMMPAIRYYRHRDGTFARFNGVSSSQQDLIATVLRYDDAMGEPTQEASQSGYQRLSGGATTLLMDVGKPPTGDNSSKAHAGCLAFELSSLRTCFITNCGAPEFGDEATTSAARSTAAHSTAILHNTSSYRFHQGGVFKRYLGTRVLAGPQRVIQERKSINGYTQIVARHDGYLRQFGVWHERILQLSDDGNLLFGRDKFFVNGGKPPTHLNKDDCAIRFHLHPSVTASIDADGAAISIKASENQTWKFSCDGGNVGLEESIFFASRSGPIASSQIVINLKLAQLSVVSWQLEQTIGTRQH